MRAGDYLQVLTDWTAGGGRIGTSFNKVVRGREYRFFKKKKKEEDALETCKSITLSPTGRLSGTRGASADKQVKRVPRVVIEQEIAAVA